MLPVAGRDEPVEDVGETSMLVSSPARGRSLTSSWRLIHTHGNPSAAHGCTSWKSDAATWT